MTLKSLEEYGHNFQLKTLFLLITKKEFLYNIYEVLNKEDFSHQAHQWIVEKLLEYYHQYNTVPNIEYFKTEIKKVDSELLSISLKDQINLVYSKHDSLDLEYVEQEFFNFIVNQQLKKALIESVDLLSTGNYDDIRSTIERALRVGQDKDIGHKYEEDTNSRYAEDDRNPIPFPWEEFNNITQGGYGKGDLVLIFGNPGGGKSWATIAMAAHAAKMGKNVLFYTLELRDTYIGKRLDAYITQTPVDELSSISTDKILNKINSQLKGKIIIKYYPPKRASFSTIENHIKKLKYLENFEPDLLIIDYVDLMKNRKNRKERKDDIDDLYTEAKSLASALNIPLVSPSQVNRMGAKDDILEADKIAGSYDKIMIGDISLSLSRKRKDKVEGTGRWHVMKNRFGPDGISYNSKIDTSTGNIEILDLIVEEDDKSYSSNTDKKMVRVLQDEFFKFTK